MANVGPAYGTCRPDASPADLDAVFKANRRNLRLLEAPATARRSRPVDWLVVGLAGLLFAAPVALPIAVGVLLITWLF